MKTDITTILYLVQVGSLLIGLICVVIMSTRMLKAIDYMKTYCKNHGSNKNNVTREFKKVIKILGGK